MSYSEKERKKKKVNDLRMIFNKIGNFVYLFGHLLPAAFVLL